MEQIDKINQLALNDLDNESENSEAPEQSAPNVNRTQVIDGDSSYKEYAEMNVPNCFEMKLGSNSLTCNQLANLIWQSYQIVLEKNGSKKNQVSYLN